MSFSSRQSLAHVHMYCKIKKWHSYHFGVCRNQVRLFDGFSAAIGEWYCDDECCENGGGRVTSGQKQ